MLYEVITKNYSVRLNNDYKVSDKLQFKLDLFGRYSPVSEPRGNEQEVFEFVNRLPPLMAVYTTDGRYSTNFMNYGNPISTFFEGGEVTTDNYNFTGKLAVEIQPVKDVNVILSYAPDFGFTYYKAMGKPVPMYVEGETEPSMYSPNKSTFVITSYSIHYTKLYEFHDGQG